MKIILCVAVFCLFFPPVSVQQVIEMGFFENKIVQIVIAMVIPFLGAWLFGLGSQANMYPWFNLIAKPSWGPPDWIFAPVWSLLYASMGYASFRVYENGHGFSGIAKNSLILYIVQLLLNWTWTLVNIGSFISLFRLKLIFLTSSQVFFNFHLLGVASLHISILLTFIILTAFAFNRIDTIAGVLMIPYIAWVTFASILTFTIWRLNS